MIFRTAIFFMCLLFTSAAQAEVTVGEPVPVLVIKELDGQALDVQAMKGRVVILHYWATWCVACQQEMPVLDAFYRKYHPRGVEMLAISLDRPRARGKAEEAMLNFQFPAALLSDADTNKLGEPAVLPVTYIIDASGIVRAKLTPDQAALTQESLASAVQPLLQK